MQTQYTNQTTDSTGEKSEPPRLDLAAKLLRYMLDPAAHRGEAENAALKFVAVAKRERIEYRDLASYVATDALVKLPQRDMDMQEPAALEVRIDFGKYAGMTLGEIGRENLSYLEWLLEECARLRPAMREAIGITLEHYLGRAAA